MVVELIMEFAPESVSVSVTILCGENLI